MESERTTRYLVVLGVIFLLIIGFFALREGEPLGNPILRQKLVRYPEIIPNHFIIVLNSSSVPLSERVDRLSRRYQLESNYLYETALTGFGAYVPPQQLAALAEDSEVALLSQERRIRPPAAFQAKTAVSFIATTSAQSDRPPTDITVRRTEADKAHAAGLTGKGVVIAAVDSGVDHAHPALKDAILPGINCADPSGKIKKDDFAKKEYITQDTHGNGTAVAGLMVGQGKVKSIAPDAKLIPIKYFETKNNVVQDISDRNLVCAINSVTDMALQPHSALRVVSLQVALAGLAENYTSDDCRKTNSRDVLYKAICQSVSKAPLTFISPAGNEASDMKIIIDMKPYPFAPAVFDNVLITVSGLADTDGQPGGLKKQFRDLWSNAFQVDDTWLSYSNWGKEVDIAAPATNGYTIDRGGKYGYFGSGTGQAAALTAGLAALHIQDYQQRFPNQPPLTWREVRQCLIDMAEKADEKINGVPRHSDPKNRHKEPVLRFVPL